GQRLRTNDAVRVEPLAALPGCHGGGESRVARHKGGEPKKTHDGRSIRLPAQGASEPTVLLDGMVPAVWPRGTLREEDFNTAVARPLGLRSGIWHDQGARSHPAGLPGNS